MLGTAVTTRVANPRGRFLNTVMSSDPCCSLLFPDAWRPRQGHSSQRGGRRPSGPGYHLVIELNCNGLTVQFYPRDLNPAAIVAVNSAIGCVSPVI